MMNTTSRPLTDKMRAALVDRGWVKYAQARGLERRGLALAVRNTGALSGYEVKLTEAGESVRDEILAPFTAGTRVRNTITGFTGHVVRVERSDRYDIVVLLWDRSENETCGSAAYLEVTESDRYAPGTTRASRCAIGDHESCLKSECVLTTDREPIPATVWYVTRQGLNAKTGEDCAMAHQQHGPFLTRDTAVASLAATFHMGLTDALESRPGSVAHMFGEQYAGLLLQMAANPNDSSWTHDNVRWTLWSVTK